MFSLGERLQNETELRRKVADGTANNLRVAMPGIVTEYNPSAVTVSVQLAIKEKLWVDGTVSDESFPLLVDVPVLFPIAGGYAITFPITAGDEVQVIFNDMCIDSFWQSGGSDNAQMDKRRHDLSDAVAIPTHLSQVGKLSGVSTGSIQIRNSAGSAIVEIAGTTININGGNINIGENTTIDGRNFMNHRHKNVMAGIDATGGVV